MKPTLKFWRRAVQLGVATAFAAIPHLNLRGVHTLSGNLLAFNAAGLPLADPLAAAQVGLISGHLTVDLLVGAGIALVLALALGTVFCSWICPFGLLSEWGHTLSRQMFPRRDAWLVRTRHGFLVRLTLFGAGLVAFVFFAGAPVLNQFSLPGWYSRAFQMYAAESYVTPAVFLMVGILALELAVQKRFWCCYVCPQAVFLIFAKLVNRSRLRLRYRPAKCICRRGFEPCREACSLSLNPKLLTDSWESECNNCADCVVTCKRLGQALTLGFGPASRPSGNPTDGLS